LHQPLWFLGEEEDREEEGNMALPRDDCGKSGVNAIRAVLTKSAEAADHVRLVLSGDVHNFQLFAPVARNRPVQLVAGIGGTKLENPGGTMKARSSFRSYGVEGSVLAIDRHGFVTLRRAGPRWDVELHDVKGDVLTHCKIPDSRSELAACSKI
jgi:hypothetical protein